MDTNYLKGPELFVLVKPISCTHGQSLKIDSPFLTDGSGQFSLMQVGIECAKNLLFFPPFPIDLCGVWGC